MWDISYITVGDPSSLCSVGMTLLGQYLYYCFGNWGNSWNFGNSWKKDSLMFNMVLISAHSWAVGWIFGNCNNIAVDPHNKNRVGVISNKCEISRISLLEFPRRFALSGWHYWGNIYIIALFFLQTGDVAEIQYNFLYAVPAGQS